MILVDAHQHYWRPGRGDYAWLARAPEALRKDFLPADLHAERDAAGVHASVLVQAAPTEAETRFLFDLALDDRCVAGVVGWVDLEAIDACARIARLVRDGGGLLRGLRPMAQDIADPDWLARPSLDRAFDCLQEHDLAFDALVDLPRLPALHHRLDRQPRLRVVLDHAAKPDIAGDGFDAWATAIHALAQRESLHCKFSGLLTLVAPGADDDVFEPFAQHLFASFGAGRLLWGSDWPVLTTHGSYARWLQLAQDLAARYAPGREADIFGGNAMRFYALDVTTDSPRTSP
jgi:L-fuconolactonase